MANVYDLIRRRTLAVDSASVPDFARTAPALPPDPAATGWAEVGPRDIGGRLTCGLVDPSDPQRIWVGAAGGGVWHSGDGGRSWVPSWPANASLHIGALALDPQKPEVLYCGTGEANLSSDSYPGIGVYRSDDGGSTWSLWKSALGDAVPTRIGSLAVDPGDSRHVRVAGIPHVWNEVHESLGGLVVTRDGGQSWVREDFVTRGPCNCHTVLFDPTQPANLYACFSETGEQAAVWRSQDNGLAWEPLTQGLPPSRELGRCALALCASQPQVLYLLAAARGEDRFRGIYRSDNRGETWAEVSPPDFDRVPYLGPRENYSSYNNTIAVNPENPDHVLWGGTVLHRTVDGGQRWEPVSQWHEPPPARSRLPWVHADQHQILIRGSADPDQAQVLAVNDGGVALSGDGGQSWTMRQEELAVTMFYDLDVHPSEPRWLSGGCQDRGTVASFDGGASFTEMSPGDGGWTLFERRSNSDRLYVSQDGFKIWRVDPSMRPDWKEITPPVEGWEREGDWVWMVFLASSEAAPDRLLTGTYRVWRSDDRGETPSNWTAGEVLDGTVVTALELSSSDADRAYAGTRVGGLFRSGDGGTVWKRAEAQGLPRRRISRIVSPHGSPDELIVTIGDARSSHVFRSTDKGDSFQDLDADAQGQRRLPEVPANALAVPRQHPERIYVATDAGIFVTPDRGGRWLDLTGNLPRARVTDLVYHEASQTLFAATYGRGIWSLAQP